MSGTLLYSQTSSSVLYDIIELCEYLLCAIAMVVFRAVQFSVRIGDEADRSSCRRPVNRREAVIVDYSTDSSVTWNLLRYLDPFTLMTGAQVVNLELPSSAKTHNTVVRWWQPTLSPGCLHCVFFI